MTNGMAGVPDKSIQRNIILGVIALVLLIGGVGGWVVATELAGAVITSGTLVVESDVKKVQHPTGGVVGEIRVKDGAKVEAGDILVRLDETVTQANLAIVVKSLNELAARRARLEAERDDAPHISFPEELLRLDDRFDAANVLAGEQKLFELRKTARRGQKAQLEERIGQLQEEITGLTGSPRPSARR